MMTDIVIKEVAARDGLQAQPKHLTLEQRQLLVEKLAVTGVPELEIGSLFRLKPYLRWRAPMYSRLIYPRKLLITRHLFPI